MVIVIWRTEKLSEIVWRFRAASMVVANLYRIRAIIPADTPPRNAWTGEGGPLASIEADAIAFKLSNASSFADFFVPDDLNCNSLER